MKVRYSIEPRDRIYVKAMGFYHLLKILVKFLIVPKNLK